MSHQKVSDLAGHVGAEVGKVIDSELRTVLKLAERRVELADENARAWRGRFNQVAKANVLGHKDRALALIERRIAIVEAVEKNDGRMRRAQVDLLRDLADDIEREWDLL